jgi:hypothetical protein
MQSDEENVNDPASNLNNTHSVALVCERTTPTEQLLLVGKDSANFCGKWVSRGQMDPYGHIISFSSPEPLLFLPSSSSIVLTRLSGPRSRPLLLRKSGSTGKRTRTFGSLTTRPQRWSLQTLPLIKGLDISVQWAIQEVMLFVISQRKGRKILHHLHSMRKIKQNRNRDYIRKLNTSL